MGRSVMDGTPCYEQLATVTRLLEGAETEIEQLRAENEELKDTLKAIDRCLDDEDLALAGEIIHNALRGGGGE